MYMYMYMYMYNVRLPAQVSIRYIVALNLVVRSFRQVWISNTKQARMLYLLKILSIGTQIVSAIGSRYSTIFSTSKSNPKWKIATQKRVRLLISPSASIMAQRAARQCMDLWDIWIGSCAPFRTVWRPWQPWFTSLAWFIQVTLVPGTWTCSMN